ncbi:uncharacterized protein [Cherax quadricarinatus]|uniref:uncharacterized protein n=1 Tax=Cherax quadricarinatus TaxID=27406 RepID=UPI00237993C1|nr:collagen alpha-2(IV) chain-like [Cherax quadricarinatus]
MNAAILVLLVFAASVSAEKHSTSDVDFKTQHGARDLTLGLPVSPFLASPYHQLVLPGYNPLLSLLQLSLAGGLGTQGLPFSFLQSLNELGFPATQLQGLGHGLPGTQFQGLGQGLHGTQFQGLGQGLTGAQLQGLGQGLPGTQLQGLGQGLPGTQFPGLGQGLPGTQFQGLGQGLPGTQFQGLGQGLPGTQFQGLGQGLPGTQFQGVGQGLPGTQFQGLGQGLPGAQFQGLGQGLPGTQFQGLGQGLPGTQFLGLGQGLPGTQFQGLDQGLPGTQFQGLGQGLPGTQFQGLGQGLPGTQFQSLGQGLPGTQFQGLGQGLPGAQFQGLGQGLPGTQFQGLGQGLPGAQFQDLGQGLPGSQLHDQELHGTPLQDPRGQELLGYRRGLNGQERRGNGLARHNRRYNRGVGQLSSSFGISPLLEQNDDQQESMEDIFQLINLLQDLESRNSIPRRPEDQGRLVQQKNDKDLTLLLQKLNPLHSLPLNSRSPVAPLVSDPPQILGLKPFGLGHTPGVSRVAADRTVEYKKILPDTDGAVDLRASRNVPFREPLGTRVLDHKDQFRFPNYR